MMKANYQLTNILCRWGVSIFLTIVNGALFAAADVAPQRVALLIGNWDYDGNGRFDARASDGYVQDLKNPCSDANLIKSALEGIHFGEDIKITCNLNKSELERETDDFARKVKVLPPGSLVFIYYAGHGMQHYGYTYEIPVLFKLMPSLDAVDGNQQLEYLHKYAVDIQRVLRKFPRRSDIGVFVALDQCRDDPIKKEVAYNEAIKILTPDNVLIQYAASAGDRTDDGKISNSEYAKILAEEISKGGPIGKIVVNVNSRTGRLYNSGERRTYSDSDVGRSFVALQSPMLTLKKEEAIATAVSLKVDRRKLIFRSTYDNPSLDIFWCEGQGEAVRFESAVSFAKAVASKARVLGVGRVMVKPLPESTNRRGGYNVFNSIMRYDPLLPNERSLLENIANEFPEMGLLPQRGIGVNGKPTPQYVSAFICGNH